MLISRPASVTVIANGWLTPRLDVLDKIIVSVFLYGV